MRGGGILNDARFLESAKKTPQVWLDEGVERAGSRGDGPVRGSGDTMTRTPGAASALPPPESIVSLQKLGKNAPRYLRGVAVC